MRLRPANAGSSANKSRMMAVKSIARRGARPAISIRYACAFLTLPASMPIHSIQRAGKQPARPQRQHHEKGDVTRQDLPFRIDARADGLGETENDAASQRPPEAAEAADDHGLEGIE